MNEIQLVKVHLNKAEGGGAISEVATGSSAVIFSFD